MNDRLFHFTAGHSGPWRITSVTTLVGEALPAAPLIDVAAGPPARLDITAAPIDPAAAPVDRNVIPSSSTWSLRGIISNERYVTRPEKTALASKQEGLGRPAATRAALIPLRKNAAWWALTQDERRAVFEEASRHIAIGMRYLPAVARRLHHCRDLSPAEPFDFLTWFEFAPEDEPAFDDLLRELRATEEWKYVDREIDLRLSR